MPFLPYTCNVCGKGGLVEYENELEARFDWIASILCHNRCADFMATKLRGYYRISIILDWWERKKMNNGDAAELRSRAWEALVRATKAFCYAVCRFYGKPLAWEPSVVDRILAAPANWKTVLNLFEIAIKRRETM